MNKYPFSPYILKNTLRHYYCYILFRPCFLCHYNNNTLATILKALINLSIKKLIRKLTNSCQIKRISFFNTLVTFFLINLRYFHNIRVKGYLTQNIGIKQIFLLYIRMMVKSMVIKMDIILNNTMYRCCVYEYVYYKVYYPSLYFSSFFWVSWK